MSEKDSTTPPQSKGQTPLSRALLEAADREKNPRVKAWLIELAYSGYPEFEGRGSDHNDSTTVEKPGVK
jgi:hypothetical protein